MELQRYVRRAGYESDFHMAAPAEYEADTSVLVQMLKKGHYRVQLGGDDWQRLYAWIDYNVPYPANWRESHRPPRDEQVQRRAEHQQLLAGIDDHDEDPLPLPPVARVRAARPAPRPAGGPLTCDHWPLRRAGPGLAAGGRGPVEMSLDLGDGVDDEVQPDPRRPVRDGQRRWVRRRAAAVGREHRPAFLPGPDGGHQPAVCPVRSAARKRLHRRPRQGPHHPGLLDRSPRSAGGADLLERGHGLLRVALAARPAAAARCRPRPSGNGPAGRAPLRPTASASTGRG